MYLRMNYSKGSKIMVHMEVEMVKGDGKKEEVLQPCVLQDHSSSWVQ